MAAQKPLIVYANYLQFGKRQSIAYDCVNSRMILWCKAGCGLVSVNGTDCDFTAGSILLAPWKHAISYQADAKDPFFLAGIHIIPRQSPGTPFVRDVAHHPGAFNQLDGLRHDSPWPGLAGFKRGHLTEESPLQALGDYIVRHFQHGAATEASLQRLASILLVELTSFFQNPQPARHTLSIDLQRAMQYMEDHLGEPLYLEQAAQVANRSVSWLHRQFRTELNTTPTHYLISLRIKKAKSLLSSTSQNIGEVGQAVGIQDPYYFSKLFKKEAGIPPRHYRRQASIF